LCSVACCFFCRRFRVLGGVSGRAPRANQSACGQTDSDPPTVGIVNECYMGRHAAMPNFAWVVLASLAVLRKATNNLMFILSCAHNFSKHTREKPMGNKIMTVHQQETTITASNKQYPVVGPESIMSKKKHGTSNTPVQDNLRWGCDRKTADRICNFNVSTT